MWYLYAKEMQHPRRVRQRCEDWMTCPEPGPPTQLGELYSPQGAGDPNAPAEACFLERWRLIS